MNAAVYGEQLMSGILFFFIAVMCSPQLMLRIIPLKKARPTRQALLACCAGDCESALVGLLARSEMRILINKPMQNAYIESFNRSFCTVAALIFQFKPYMQHSLTIAEHNYSNIAGRVASKPLMYCALRQSSYLLPSAREKLC